MPAYRARIRLIRAYEGDALFEAPDMNAAKKLVEKLHLRPDAATSISWKKVGEPTFVYGHVYNSSEEHEFRANEDADPNPVKSVMPTPAPLAPPAATPPRAPPTRRRGAPVVKGKGR